MGERTLAEIATSGAPSWVTGTPEEAFVRFVSTHGPYKTETLLFQCAAGDDFKENDTFSSQLAHPLFCTVVSAADRGNTTEGLQSATVNSDESDANFKQITLHDAADNTGFGVVITVYGF